MRVADTSFLVAFFDADDHRHEDARRQTGDADPLVIGPEVLVETIGVLKVKAGRPAADRALEDLMRLANVEWANQSDIPAAHRLYQQELGLSFVDASVVATCVRLGVLPLTYDERQGRAVARRLGGP